jgi:hypothetical protein
MPADRSGSTFNNTVRLLVLLAVIATPVAGLALLVPRSFVATHCFRTATFGGCSSTPETFVSMLSNAPEQIAPFLLALGALCVLAAVTGIALDRGASALATAAFAIGAYAFLIAGASIALGPFLLVPLLLLVAALARTLGATSAQVVRLIGRLCVLALGAFAAAYLFAQLWASRLGAFPGGGFDTFWFYVALASAAGVAIGVGLGAARGRPGEIARGLVLGYLAFGVAGVVVAVGSLPILYPRGIYASLGLAALWGSLEWLVLTNVMASTLALRVATGLPWSSSAKVGVALSLAALFSGIATAVSFGPLAVTGMAPPLLFLPNTSTLP